MYKEQELIIFIEITASCGLLLPVRIGYNEELYDSTIETNASLKAELFQFWLC